MIVILGDEDDLYNLLVYQELCRRQVDVVFIKASELSTAIGLHWLPGHPQGENFLTLAARKIPLATLSGVLVRLQSLLAAPTDMTQEDQQYVRSELDATLVGWLHALACVVINRPLPGLEPGPLCTNIDRMRRALACGFRLPAAMVTSTYENACQFYERYGQHVWLRAPSWQTPWQLIEGAAGRQELRAMVAQHPVYLQDIPTGQVCQVLTVGHRVFGAVAPAACLASQGPQLALQPLALPAAIQERCGSLARAFHVEFAQFTLLQTTENNWYCLDVNPFPVYVPCETSLQAALITALADLLSSGDRRAADDFTLWHAGRPSPGLCLSMPGRER